MKFAIFDVDLTLTSRDTFIEFYRFLCQEDKRFCTYINNVLGSAILYGLKVYDEKQSKEKYLTFLRGLSENIVDRLCYKFFRTYIMDKLLYEDGILEIKKRKDEGYQVILISASPEFYLKYFKDFTYVDHVIGTKYEVVNGYHTGKMIGNNNKGLEKVARFYEYLYDNNIEEFDLRNSLMYSDSLHDSPLFSIVGRGFLINSKKNVEGLTNLYWK